MRKVFAFIKRYVPQSLFGRSLLIIVVPVVFMQAAVATAFFNAHWRTVTESLASSTAGDVALIVKQITPITDEPQGVATLKSDVFDHMHISIAWQPKRTLPPRERYAFFTLVDTVLKRALQQALPNNAFWFDTTRYPGYVDIRVQLPDGVLRVLAPRERVFSTTGHIFVFWLAATTLLLTAVSVIFIRNQVKAIERLAAAADAFGRGQDVERFKPSGAREVRQAAKAFLAMKARISRHLEQRTTLLAAVSHDLRTPLTRLKLAVAMMPKSDQQMALNTDIQDMQHLIDEYLDFASDAKPETATECDVTDLIGAEVDMAREIGTNIEYDPGNVIMATIRPISLRRCIRNLLSNAGQHAGQVAVSIALDKSVLDISIDDDGPGIQPDVYEDAFTPFNRLDEARNQNTKGAGLGLAIARDAARQHGGDLTLDKSPMGGLRARIRLPV